MNKSLVLIDDANLYYGFKRDSWEMDYQLFYQWLEKNFSLIAVHIFAGIITKKAFFDIHPQHTLTGFIQSKNEREDYFKYLKKIGYAVTQKPVASLYDSTSGDYKRKCNCDVEITITALDKINEYEEFVLCSGDGDFVKLIKYLKGKYKKTTVIAHGHRLNSELADCANRLILFNQIRSEVEKKKGLP